MREKQKLRYEKRILAVEAVGRGESVKLVCRVMKIAKSSIYEWLARHSASGKDGLKDGKKSGRPSKLNAKMIEWLYDAITMGDPRQQQFNFGLWSLRVIRVMLYKKYGIQLHKSSICRLMKQLGITPQKPLFKAYKQNPKAVETWKNRDFPRIKKVAKKHGWNIYFTDESGFRSDYHRGTSWGKPGQTPIVKEHRGRHSINLISAINSRGRLWFSAFEGRMDSERFIEFLEKMLGDIEGKILLIADRAKFQTSKATRDFVKKNKLRLRIFYLPAYSPELNPYEQVWNQAKAKMGKKIIANKEEMKLNAKQILKNIQKKTKLIISFFHLTLTKYIIN